MERNPVEGRKLGLLAAGLALLGGGAYYYIDSKKGEPTDLKITGYQNLTTGSQIYLPPAKMPAKSGDVIRVHTEFSYCGKYQSGVQVHVCTWVPGTGWLGWANRTDEISSNDKYITLDNSLWPKKYRNAVDFALATEDAGSSYNIGFWIKSIEGPDYTGPSIDQAVVVQAPADGDGDGGVPSTPAGFWNPSITLLSTVPEDGFQVGDQVRFKVSIWYKGPSHEYDYKIEWGVDGITFDQGYTSGEGAKEGNCYAAPLDTSTPILVDLGTFSWTVPQVHQDNHPDDNIDIQLMLDGYYFWYGLPLEIDYEEVIHDAVPFAGSPPSVTVSPAQVQAGDYIKITILNFPKNAGGKVTWAETSGELPFTTDSKGEWSKSLMVTDPAGNYNITAIAGVVSASASYQMLTGGEMSAGFSLPLQLVQETPIIILPLTIYDLPAEIPMTNGGFRIRALLNNTSQVDLYLYTEVTVTRPDNSTDDYVSHSPRYTDKVEAGEMDKEEDCSIGVVQQAGIWYVHVRLMGMRVPDGQPEELAVLDTDFQVEEMISTLEILNPTIKSGDYLNFTWSGFTPNAQVWIGLYGGGGAYFSSDAQGAGSGSIQINETAGNHLLVANDGVNYETASFVIEPSGIATLGIYNWQIAGGDYLNFVWSNFKPNTSVTIGVKGGGSFPYMSNGQGGGEGAFMVTEPVGNYILEADDGENHAEASFSVIW